MAFTSINDGKLYFNTELYTGNGSTNAQTGVGFQPDWLWIKCRSDANGSNIFDALRSTNSLHSDTTGAEADRASDGFTSLDNDGFTLNGSGSGGSINVNSRTYASWNWLAAGTAPSNTYAVKVVSDSGNKYRFDDFGTSAVTLEISEGGTFTFDQSDSSNNGHPLRFATQADGANSSQYTTGVTTNGTPGQAGAYTRITVAASAPTLFYYCTSHSGMGGQANTPVTNSFSNFAGTIQSNISPNTTSGFSIVKYTGTGANATVGHGLGVAPSMIIVKKYNVTGSWGVYHNSLGNGYFLYLNSTNASASNSTLWNNTSPTSSVFNLGSSAISNSSSNSHIAYCFAEKQGYSKFGSYTGNGNADGTFVYTGFKPAFVMSKRTDATDGWRMMDATRSSFNVAQNRLLANASDAEVVASSQDKDFLSNGFKMRTSDSGYNASATYIYMCFAENPFTSSTGTPVTAR